MKDQMQFETNGLTVLAVNIAPDASEIRILDKDENYCKKGDLVYKTSQNVWGQGDHVLPDGKWKLIDDMKDVLLENGIDPAEKWVLLTMPTI